MSLEEGDDLGETVVAHILEATENAGPEEDLGVAETVVVGIELQRGEDLLRSNLAIDETFGDRVGGQDGVPAFSESPQYYDCTDTDKDIEFIRTLCIPVVLLD